MTPWYNTPDRIAALAKVAQSWIGTPFVPNAAIRGAGVSCQKLVGRLYIESGFLPETFSVPEGAMNWGAAQKVSLIAAFMAKQSNFAEILDAKLATPLPGDMLGFRIGGCVHHCGVVIAMDGTFVHAMRRTNVAFSNVRDATFLQRLDKIWRPQA